MTQWKKYTGLTVAGLAMGIAGLSIPQTVQAQDATETRFYVELKGASLYDALEMLFEAGGNEGRSIDPSARNVYIGSFVRNNVDWYNAVLQLARDHNFRVYRDKARTVHIEPRVPVVEENPGGFPAGAIPGQRPPVTRPGGRPAFGPGGVPWEDFIRGMSYNPQEVVPAPGDAEDNGIRTIIRSNAQTRPTFGGNRGGTNNNATRGGTNPDAQYSLVLVKHVYVGGIAQLFRGNVGVISTEQFVVPASAGAQGGRGTGIAGARGGRGGIGGFGGIGGIGGTTGGFGGIGGTTGGFGGFGGNTGGFGGGIGGNIGGFGGGIGGIGGFGR